MKLIALSALLVLSACGNGRSTEVVQLEYRLLADDLVFGQPWTTQLATSPRDLPPPVQNAGLNPDSEVDWDHEVVFIFVLAESSSCPYASAEGLEFSNPDQRLYPVVPIEGAPTACTGDAQPYGLVVAVDRSDLPDTPFDLWVEPDDPPQGVVDGVTRVVASDLEE